MQLIRETTVQQAASRTALHEQGGGRYEGRQLDAQLVVPPTARWQDSGTVLVIDDDPGVGMLLLRALRVFGLDAVVAGNGTEGLSLLAASSTPIRCVLMDQWMPGLAAAPLLSALRQQCPTSPVIIMSGANEADALVADGFLPKPFTLECLASVLQQVLRDAD